MISKIDWISFSVPIRPPGGTDERPAFHALQSALLRLHPQLPQWLLVGEEYQAGNGRAPYATSWKHHAGGWTFFTHPALPHALVEISGRGCELLADGQSLFGLLAATQKRVTRLDIASDMLTGTRPIEFTSKRQEGRFQAHSEVVSGSGETSYIGSSKSDRYCRVYRYNEPHERSHLLRCEFVIKAENAKNTATAILSQGLQSVVLTLGQAFGWQHPDWQPDAQEAAEIEVWRPERREGKTVFWLADTVAPLLVRLHNEGTIDIYQWLTDHVIPRIISSSDD